MSLLGPDHLLTKKFLTDQHGLFRESGIAPAGFRDYTDQYENRLLTALGQQLGIEAKLHHHVGRETFATNFIRQGGKAEVLQKLLNHVNIRDTMKYVHVDDDMKCEAIEALDARDAGQFLKSPQLL